MILALETGWTPDVIGTIPVAFRAACHWALFVRSIVGADGLPNPTIPAGAPATERLNVMRLQVAMSQLRDSLFPEDEDV